MNRRKFLSALSLATVPVIVPAPLKFIFDLGANLHHSPKFDELGPWVWQDRLYIRGDDSPGYYITSEEAGIIPEYSGDAQGIVFPRADLWETDEDTKIIQKYYKKLAMCTVGVPLKA